MLLGVAAFVVASIGIACWRIEAVFRAVVGTRAAQRTRELDLREREIAIVERLKAEPVEPEPIPPDLMALALQQSEPFAQDDILKVIRQTYAETRDWNMARRAVGRAAFRDPAVGMQ